MTPNNCFPFQAGWWGAGRSLLNAPPQISLVAIEQPEKNRRLVKCGKAAAFDRQKVQSRSFSLTPMRFDEDTKRLGCNKENLSLFWVQPELLTQVVCYEVLWSSPAGSMTSVVAPVPRRCLLNQDRCCTELRENEVLTLSAGREDLFKALVPLWKTKQ